MLQFLTNIFQKKQINLFAPIPLSACEIRKQYLLDRENIHSGTVIMLAIPYFTEACLDPNRNLSAYAVAKDYHLFYKELFDELIPLLKEQFPGESFAGFADHSPIAELQAAAMAGLGVIGKNGLLITESYSSYVFLGEIITSIELDVPVKAIQACIGCGKCQKACPIPVIGTCLSSLTQKKGQLTTEEASAILRYQTVWGCDICQEVCPYTKNAITEKTIFSKIPFFSQDTISHLTLELLDNMSDEEFAKRAYSWRGRDTIRRNLLIVKEQGQESVRKGDPCST